MNEITTKTITARTGLLTMKTAVAANKQYLYTLLITAAAI